MSRKAVDAVFQAFFLLTDLRVLLRETAPSHEMDGEQKARAVKSVEKLKKQVAVIEEEVIS